MRSHQLAPFVRRERVSERYGDVTTATLRLLMIAEVIPEAYDAGGKKVFRPDLRHKRVRPTFPMGRFLSQPLVVKCTSVRDIRKFLFGCRYVSDEEQFGKRDYWQPPEEFEQTKRGDCDDFALWTWRELLDLGYDARFVWGRSGRYGAGHAWVQFFKDGKCYLVEPGRCMVGDTMPRLSTAGYRPEMSVGLNGNDVSYYSHERRNWHPRIPQLIGLIAEWLIFWGQYWARVLPRLPFWVGRRIWRW